METRPVIGFRGYLAREDGGIIDPDGGLVLPGLVYVPGSYHKVTIKRNPGDIQGEAEFVHRLVCEAWHGPNPGGLWVLHWDDDRYNNAQSNLYWGTPADNAGDRLRNGCMRGLKMDHGKAAEMRRLRAEGWTQPQLARHFGISQPQVSVTLSGKCWR